MAVTAWVGLAGAWAAWNGARFVLDPSLRHRAEAAWFIFGTVVLVVGAAAIWTAKAQQRPLPPSPVRPPRGYGLLAILCLLAAALYGGVLTVGLLSDDFVLLERARTGRWADPAWDYIRPLPLAMWWLIDRVLSAAMVPAALHVLNVAIHGFNAWLVSRVAVSLGFEPRHAVVAAILFLTSPYSVEPVAWASGIFDLVVTACILAMAVVFLKDAWALPAHAATVLLLLAAALLSKETAVAAPALLALLIPFVRDRRRGVALVGVCAVIVCGYVAWRLVLGVASPAASLSGYAAKELISRPFGTVGLGVHANLGGWLLGLAVFLTLLWPALLVRASMMWRSSPEGFRVVAMGSGWVLCSTLPLLTMLYVGPDLQGSRYLYLGSAMWAIAVAALIHPRIGAPVDRHALALSALIVMISVTALVAHQRPWREAGALTRSIVAAARAVGAPCTPVSASGLPDTINGAYVLRNGFAEAVRDRASSARDTEPCHLHWDGSTFTVRR